MADGGRKMTDVYTDRSNVIAELEKMGFKGGQIRRLVEHIVDNNSMQDFFNFIILHGDGMSKLLLVDKFIRYMKDKESPLSYEQFVDAYESCNTNVEKIAVIAKLLVTEKTNELNHVIDFIEQEGNTLDNSYRLLKRFRDLYTVEEIIILMSVR